MNSGIGAALRERVAGRMWLADGGLETAMVFLEGFDLPQFAAFPLLRDPVGRAKLRAYFDGFLNEARVNDAGYILDTATWRASHGWGPALGLSAAEIDTANRESVAFALELRAAHPQVDVIVNGVLGPHGDAYAPDQILSEQEAQQYHAPQIAELGQAGADMITGVTLSSVGEAVGIARAAFAQNLPVVLSFTVETDGNLVSGLPLGEAIAQTDAATGGSPAWYMINCAHPDHFRHVLTGEWVRRVGAIRANASRLSHAELDEAPTLDAGNPDELAGAYRELIGLLPGLQVFGGCCGTDLRHVAAIGRACSGHFHPT